MNTPIDFHCGKCGKKCPVAPDPPVKAVCEDCCEDHDYKYESFSRKRECVHCGKEMPHDWFDNESGIPRHTGPIGTPAANVTGEMLDRMGREWRGEQ